MLIDTHCHLNILAKKDFDTSMNETHFAIAKIEVEKALAHQVTTIINVGTSLIESNNCIALAKRFDPIYAVVGIHPNDLTDNWKSDFQKIAASVKEKEKNKIVGIGECGFDKHYKDYNIQRQSDAFQAQIDLALENDLALVVHTRDAADETLRMLEQYKGHINKGIIHCFSEDLLFANTCISWGFAIGIGGTITYPKNEQLRLVGSAVALHNIVLETDTPYLAPQSVRGQPNTPAYISLIAQYLADLRKTSYNEIAQITTARAQQIFSIKV